ncbi:hypothetical protein ACU686_03400 [Yinghuangia aomiensis]
MPVDLDGVGTLAFGEALHRHLDITRTGTDLLRFFADRAGDRLLRKLLRHDNKGELARWSWGRQAADVLAEYPVRASAQEWADVLTRLRSRLYSISSSPRTDPALVSLTVSVVRYENSRGRARTGVCSASSRTPNPAPAYPSRCSRPRTSGRPPTPPPPWS